MDDARLCSCCSARVSEAQPVQVPQRGRSPSHHLSSGPGVCICILGNLCDSCACLSDVGLVWGVVRNSVGDCKEEKHAALLSHTGRAPLFQNDVVAHEQSIGSFGTFAGLVSVERGGGRGGAWSCPMAYKHSYLLYVVVVVLSFPRLPSLSFCSMSLILHQLIAATAAAAAPRYSRYLCSCFASKSLSHHPNWSVISLPPDPFVCIALHLWCIKIIPVVSSLCSNDETLDCLFRRSLLLYVLSPAPSNLWGPIVYLYY